MRQDLTRESRPQSQEHAAVDVETWIFDLGRLTAQTKSFHHLQEALFDLYRITPRLDNLGPKGSAPICVTCRPIGLWTQPGAHEPSPQLWVNSRAEGALQPWQSIPQEDASSICMNIFRDSNREM
ncbi:uncharacterized protein LOC143300083 [Babylonia areolata]|uniref:uncharacterized protein LOC143300083 n=1 Tax=Babylonia areolata TaxID=304850 RepID=UPI003FD5C40C